MFHSTTVFAFRLNLLGHHSGVAGRDVVKFDRWGVAPSLTFGLGKPTRFTASYYKLKQNNISDYGIPWVPVTNNVLVEFRDRPAPVPRNTFYGLRDRDFESSELRSRHAQIRAISTTTCRCEISFVTLIHRETRSRHRHVSRITIQPPSIVRCARGKRKTKFGTTKLISSRAFQPARSSIHLLLD